MDVEGVRAWRRLRNNRAATRRVSEKDIVALTTIAVLPAIWQLLATVSSRCPRDVRMAPRFKGVARCSASLMSDPITNNRPPVQAAPTTLCTPSKPSCGARGLRGSCCDLRLLEVSRLTASDASRSASSTNSWSFRASRWILTPRCIAAAAAAAAAAVPIAVHWLARRSIA